MDLERRGQEQIRCRNAKRTAVRFRKPLMESLPKTNSHLRVVPGGQRRVGSTATVVYRGEQEAFLHALREQEPAATAALFDAHHSSILTVLARVIDVDSELRDLQQDGQGWIGSYWGLSASIPNCAICSKMDRDGSGAIGGYRRRSELRDLPQEVFMRTLRRVHTLRDGRCREAGNNWYNA
jgi:hypothetical protein